MFIKSKFTDGCSYCGDSTHFYQEHQGLTYWTCRRCCGGDKFDLKRNLKYEKFFDLWFRQIGLHPVQTMTLLELEHNPIAKYHSRRARAIRLGQWLASHVEESVLENNGTMFCLTRAQQGFDGDIKGWRLIARDSFCWRNP